MRYILIFLITIVVNTADAQDIPQSSASNRSDAIHIAALAESNQTGLELRYKSLYHMNDKIKLGWGTGFTTYNASLRRSFIPITVETMNDIYVGKAIPFYSISAGYAIAIPEEESFAESSRGGFRFDSSIGIRSNGEGAQSYISLGFNLQKAKYPGLDFFGNLDKKVTYKRWTLALGILW